MIKLNKSNILASVLVFLIAILIGFTLSIATSKPTAKSTAFAQQECLNSTVCPEGTSLNSTSCSCVSNTDQPVADPSCAARPTNCGSVATIMADPSDTLHCPTYRCINPTPTVTVTPTSSNICRDLVCGAGTHLDSATCQCVSDKGTTPTPTLTYPNCDIRNGVDYSKYDIDSNCHINGGDLSTWLSHYGDWIKAGYGDLN